MLSRPVGFVNAVSGGRVLGLLGESWSLLAMEGCRFLASWRRRRGGASLARLLQLKGRLSQGCIWKVLSGEGLWEGLRVCYDTLLRGE